MSQGYYDPHPLLALDRPLALVGHPAAGCARVAREIAGRTGIAFNDVERATEGFAGRSSSQIVVEEGLSELIRLETRALHQAVRRRPCGVVAVASRLLEDRALAAWLIERTCLVYIRRPDAVLLERLRRRAAAAPGSLPEFLAGVPTSVQGLQLHLAERESVLRQVDVVFDAASQHPSRVADEILGALDRLVSVAPLTPGSAARPLQESCLDGRASSRIRAAPGRTVPGPVLEEG